MDTNIVNLGERLEADYQRFLELSERVDELEARLSDTETKLCVWIAIAALPGWMYVLLYVLIGIGGLV